MTVNLFTSLENVYGVVSFYFLPTILMLLCYVLLYYQLEIMMTVSRIESSQNYVGRLKSKYVAECIRITMLTLIYVFVALQLLLMVLCFFELISMKTFFIEIIVFTAVIVLGLNINQLVVYFKLSGLPYKSKQHYFFVRKVGIVCFVWSMAFIAKLVAVGCGQNLFLYDLDGVSVY